MCRIYVCDQVGWPVLEPFKRRQLPAVAVNEVESNPSTIKAQLRKDAETEK